MNRIKLFAYTTLGALALLCSCQNMLYVESDRYIYEKDHSLGSANDSLYSTAGILAKLQRLGDRYVLLGELRADLMDVTHNADMNLQELSNLSISPDNPYIDVNDFYVVINHCNYLIDRMDTSVVVGGERRMKREYVAAKAVRAWTYLQIVYNFGEAWYFTDPILTVQETNEVKTLCGQRKSLDEVIDLLIADLLPYADYPMPQYNGIGGSSAVFSLFPHIHYLLGEMYLWKNDYAQAAFHYYQDIFANEMSVSRNYVSRYMPLDHSGAGNASNANYDIVTGWNQVYGSLGECIFGTSYYVSTNTSNYVESAMYNLTYTSYKVKPSDRAMDFFQNQTYVDMSTDESGTRNIVTTGDLRGELGSFNFLMENLSTTVTDGMTTEDLRALEDKQILKEELGVPYISIYVDLNYTYMQKSSLAYLRYAEAVNRLGKPSVALAVLNYGLDVNTLSDTLRVNLAEVDASLLADWNKVVFENASVGTRTRGAGATNYVMVPSDCTNKSDSIDYVEKILLEECGLESAFCGNRYHDLMRYTRHAPVKNYIAEALSLKWPERRGEFMAREEKDWFIAYPEP